MSWSPLSGNLDRIETPGGLNISDILSDPYFSEVISLARELFEVPFCVISFIGKDRKWVNTSRLSDSNNDFDSLDLEFSNHVVTNDGPLFLDDATQDDRFHNSPLVVGGARVRFYAGTPLIVDDTKVGVLCVIDRKPRHLKINQIVALKKLASMVAIMLDKLQIISELGQFKDSFPTEITSLEDLKCLLQLNCDEIPDVSGSFGLLVIHLDRSKEDNKALGPVAQNQSQLAVADRLKSLSSNVSLVARFGGDEFAIVMRTQGDPWSEHRTFCLQILAAISEPFVIRDKLMSFEASIGVAIAPYHGTDVETLVRNAYAALDKVKLKGTNSFAFFDDDLDDEASERREIEADLAGAIDRAELELYYQHAVELATGRTIAAEALLRWHHPRRGTIGPELFIPFAEKTGLIVPIGEWVIEQACRDAMTWPQEMSVAVNLSAAQLGGSKLLNVVERALDVTGLPPGRLVIEVTETTLLPRNQLFLAELRQLHDKGIRLALDDFGTGYGSLGYLQMLPFNEIKIDRCFVENVAWDPQSKAIVRAVINLARDLGLDVTAEGVGTKMQVDFLISAGCGRGQGYLFGRPVPNSLLMTEVWPRRNDLLEEH